MPTQGRCERCMNYDKQLEEINGKMLCRECRDEEGKVSKPHIRFRRIQNPFTRILNKLKRDIRRKRSGKEEKINK